MRALKSSLLAALTTLFAVSCTTSHAPGGMAKGDPGATAGTQQSGVEHTLGVGDELTVRVWRHDDLTRSVIVSPSGTITLPMVGEIQADGVAVSKLRADIAARMSEFLVNPCVDVNVSRVVSQFVYVLGEVMTPGVVSLDRKMDVMTAIARSGGVTQDANKSQVLHVRHAASGVEVKVFDFEGSLTGRTGGKAIGLCSGDIVYVVPSRIANVDRFMTRFGRIIAPFIDVERGIIFAPDVKEVLQRGEKKQSTIIAP